MPDASDAFGLSDSAFVQIQIGNHWAWEYFNAFDWFMVIAGLSASALIAFILVKKWKENQAIRQQQSWEHMQSQ